MKILAISDEECAALYDFYIPGRLDGYDLIISCGDLKSKYLSFLVTMAHCPVVYVHGNHDEHYDQLPPEGCDCIEDTILVYRGIRILGLGGCRQYHPGKYQHSERQMSRRIAKLRRMIKKHKGVDIVVTHAPPEGVGDLPDAAHRGFAAFLELMEQYRPRYLLHGHIHLRYARDKTRERTYLDTQVINVCERYELNVPDVAKPGPNTLGGKPYV